MKKCLWLILTIFVMIPILQAQDATPEPTLTSSDLYDWSHTLYFPQRVDFTLLAKRRESEISTLQLTINYNGADPITQTLESVIATSTRRGTVYSYSWQIPSNPPPPLFSTLRYRWDITTTDGREVVASNSFIYEDTRIRWAQSGDLESRVDVYHPDNMINIAGDIRTGIREPYDLLLANKDDKPTYKLLIYPEDTPVGCDRNEEGDPIITIPSDGEPEEVPCDLDLANRIFEQGNFLVFNNSSEASIQQSLIELLVEAYYTEQWGSTDVPDWFLRGLQRFYDPRPDTEALTIAQQRSRSDDLLSLNELATEPTDDTLYDIWDAQSTGLVIYLADTIGVDALFNLANSLGNLDEDETFAEAYKDIVGEDFDLLLLSWQDWLFRSSTADDYEYHPYLPDTATPTVTPTATNTPTVTFTPSITPDVTSTPRPTITRRPPTPSVTPLPAQSFSVQPTDVPPTPIPQEPQQGFVADDGLMQRLAIGGGVILLLLVVLFFVLRQR